jgi:hypothetical protein
MRDHALEGRRDGWATTRNGSKKPAVEVKKGDTLYPVGLRSCVIKEIRRSFFETNDEFDLKRSFGGLTEPFRLEMDWKTTSPRPL